MNYTSSLLKSDVSALPGGSPSFRSASPALRREQTFAAAMKLELGTHKRQASADTLSSTSFSGNAMAESGKGLPVTAKSAGSSGSGVDAPYSVSAPIDTAINSNTMGKSENFIDHSEGSARLLADTLSFTTVAQAIKREIAAKAQPRNPETVTPFTTGKNARAEGNSGKQPLDLEASGRHNADNTAGHSLFLQAETGAASPGTDNLIVGQDLPDSSGVDAVLSVTSTSDDAAEVNIPDLQTTANTTENTAGIIAGLASTNAHGEMNNEVTTNTETKTSALSSALAFAQPPEQSSALAPLVQEPGFSGADRHHAMDIEPAIVNSPSLVTETRYDRAPADSVFTDSLSPLSPDNAPDAEAAIFLPVSTANKTTINGSDIEFSIPADNSESGLDTETSESIALGSFNIQRGKYAPARNVANYSPQDTAANLRGEPSDNLRPEWIKTNVAELTGSNPLPGSSALPPSDILTASSHLAGISDATSETTAAVTHLHAASNFPPTAQQPGSAPLTAPAQLYSAHTMGSQLWLADMGAQLSWLKDSDIQNAEIMLHPADLGSLEISISMQDDRTVVKMVAASAQTRELLEASLPRLRELLGNAGLHLEQGSVSQGNEHQHQQALARHQATGQQRGLDPGSKESTPEALTIQRRSLSLHQIDHYA